MKILRLIFTIIIVIPIVPITLFGILAYYFCKLFHIKAECNPVTSFCYYLTCWWLKVASFCRLHIEGRENIPQKNEAVIYAPNHNSFFDVPFFYLAIKRFIPMMAKKELYKVPIVHGGLVSMGCIPIARGSMRGVLESVHKGIEYVENGKSLVIFPEGTRSKTGRIGTFKDGAFKIAERTHCRVVPIVIKNDRYLMENAFRLGIVDVYIKILPPIEVEGMDHEEVKQIASLVQNEVEKEWEKYPDWPTKKH